jgi:CheY-like chemotaxis protein
VQLLGDTGLDNFQKVLTSTIKSCGSTLHETLSSVLSYAKINQFERRQDRYPQRRPPDSAWALTDKHSVTVSPDKDFAGPYISVNIAMLCEEIVRMLEAGMVFGMSKGGYTLVVILNIRYEDNWCFCTEPGALRRIAANIIGNAMKYTPQGSVTVTLTTSQEIDDKRSLNNDHTSGHIVNLTVTDTGKGMSKDFLENHLFVPFTQEDATTSEGVGLGMSIVKSLVSLLGGEIFVKSDAGKGTEIRVSMPMRQNTEDQDGLEQPAVEFAQDIKYLRSIRLSVVVFGFPGSVHDSVEIYLLEWFQCTMLDITDDRNPDIIIVEEGNAEARDAIEKSAPRYGHQGVLLSIVMDPPRLGKKMEEIEGYPQCERLPRPLGPRYLSRALMSCVNKLKHLRDGKTSAKGEKSQQDEEAKEKENPDEGIQRPRSALSQSAVQQEEASTLSEGAWDGQLSNRRSELRVLIVDDNALNTRLLGAFLKKYGCRNIQKAEDGAVAVEAVKKHPECYDIIFMGTFFFRASYLSFVISLSTSAATTVLIGGTLHSLRHATRISCGNSHPYTARF